MAGRLRPIDLGTAVLLSGKSTFCPTILKCEGAYPSSPTRQRIPGFDLDVARFKKVALLSQLQQIRNFFGSDSGFNRLEGSLFRRLGPDDRLI
jgi:hypothetical protein